MVFPGQTVYMSYSRGLLLDLPVPEKKSRFGDFGVGFGWWDFLALFDCLFAYFCKFETDSYSPGHHCF